MATGVSTIAAWRPTIGRRGATLPSDQIASPLPAPAPPTSKEPSSTSTPMTPSVQPTSQVARGLEPVSTVATLAANAMEAVADSVVLELWEGVVQATDKAAGWMDVVLEAKRGALSTHTARIELQWVAEQDIDLVEPGAVFYLTLYKRIRHGTIQNAQELRFRRRPGWSKQQLAKVTSDAEALGRKFVPRPLSE